MHNTTYLKARIQYKLAQDLASPSAHRVKPSYPVCSEILEDKMERPGIDTRSYAYHWENGEMVAGRK